MAFMQVVALLVLVLTILLPFLFMPPELSILILVISILLAIAMTLIVERYLKHRTPDFMGCTHA